MIKKINFNYFLSLENIYFKITFKFYFNNIIIYILKIIF